MTRDGRGPAGYRQAAFFAGDEEAQTFDELEGGGKEAFTRMQRDGLYSAYTWRVRQFKEGETNETTIRFTPDGHPYGFVERLKEDAPGPTLDAGDARGLAEREAASRWNGFQPLRVRRAGAGAPAGRTGRPYLHVRASHADVERGAAIACALSCRVTS
jgi:hypothetical protein